MAGPTAQAPPARNKGQSAAWHAFTWGSTNILAISFRLGQVFQFAARHFEADERLQAGHASPGPW